MWGEMDKWVLSSLLKVWSRGGRGYQIVPALQSLVFSAQ